MARTKKAADAKARQIAALDAALDEALDDTFPASDPVSIGAVTGTEPPAAPVDRKSPLPREPVVSVSGRRAPSRAARSG